LYASSIWGAIKDRRSIHEYLPRDIPNGVLQKVLEATVWAPSAHNAQPWRFVVIKDPKVKETLAEAMAKEWSKDLRKDGLPPEDHERLTKASIKRFTESPTLIIACLTMEDMDTYQDERRRKAEYTMAVQSVAASVQNLLLRAHAEGLGTCWFCAPLFCPKKVKEVLRLPENVEPQALITLGYPSKKPEVPPRKSLKSVVYHNYWGCSG